MLIVVDITEVPDFNKVRYLLEANEVTDGRCTNCMTTAQSCSFTGAFTPIPDSFKSVHVDEQ